MGDRVSVLLSTCRYSHLFLHRVRTDRSGQNGRLPFILLIVILLQGCFSRGLPSPIQARHRRGAACLVLGRGRRRGRASASGLIRCHSRRARLRRLKGRGPSGGGQRCSAGSDRDSKVLRRLVYLMRRRNCRWGVGRIFCSRVRPRGVGD